MEQLVASILILLAGSAFCSSSEAALFSISKAQVDAEKKKKTPNAHLLANIKKSIKSSVGAIVILNNLFNIVGTIYAGIIASQLFTPGQVGIFSAFLTFLVILFGEILPKSYGERFALSYALKISPIIQIITKILFPVLWMLEQINLLIFGEKTPLSVSEEEIASMIDQGFQSNSIEKDEHEMIHNVFSLNDKTAEDIMTPRVNIDALDGNKTLEEQKEFLLDAPHSRLPVYAEDIDNISGYVLLREALEYMAKGQGSKKAESIQQNILFVREQTRVDTLLLLFQRKHIHIAIVKDQFGGTSGIVTLEDVLEQVVGEIIDETDEYVDMREISQINTNQPQTPMV